MRIELIGKYEDVLKQAEDIKDFPKEIKWELDKIIVLTGEDVPVQND